MLGGLLVSQVVHIDNSGFFRKMMKMFLAEMGYESEDYERGGDAIYALQNKRVACVITGLELTDMSGEELIKRLKIYSQPMSIIAVTSTTEEERIKRLLSQGVLAVIQKTGNWKEELRKILL
jgi:DNA-binding response OmpR family regulator